MCGVQLLRSVNSLFGPTHNLKKSWMRLSLRPAVDDLHAAEINHYRGVGCGQYLKNLNDSPDSSAFAATVGCSPVLLLLNSTFAG